MMVIPQNIAKLMSPEDRRAFGKGAMTAEDALAKAEVTNERALQKQIVGLLRLKGIEPIVSTFGKRTTNNIGTPDIIFAVVGTANEAVCDDPIFACAWEVKLPNYKPRKDQVHQGQMHIRLSTPPNGWSIKIIKSVDEAIEELKELGIS